VTWVVSSRHASQVPPGLHVADDSAAKFPTHPYRSNLRMLRDSGGMASNIHFPRWNYCTDFAGKRHILAVVVGPAADLPADKTCSRLLQRTADDTPCLESAEDKDPSETNAGPDSGPDSHYDESGYYSA
jgi:hypothetical protein